MVDLDDPDWSFPQPDNLVQDGRALRFPDGRFGGPPRFVEPSGLSQRTHDCKFYQRALGFFFSLADLSSTSQDQVARHFMARAFGLIIVPAMVYLFWFWVHFRVLNRSGTGDEFMSPAFQQTLLESPLTLNAEGEE